MKTGPVNSICGVFSSLTAAAAAAAAAPATGGSCALLDEAEGGTRGTGNSDRTCDVGLGDRGESSMGALVSDDSSRWVGHLWLSRICKANCSNVAKPFSGASMQIGRGQKHLPALAELSSSVAIFDDDGFFGVCLDISSATAMLPLTPFAEVVLSA